MGPLAQNAGDNLRHVPWNNNNIEYEGGRQNGLFVYEDSLRKQPSFLAPGPSGGSEEGRLFSQASMKTVYEYTRHL